MSNMVKDPPALGHHQEGLGGRGVGGTAEGTWVEDVDLTWALTPEPPVTGHDKPWPFFHFWCHQF